MDTFVYTRVTLENSLNLPQEFHLTKRVYAFFQTDPYVPDVGNKYAFVVNYLAGVGAVQADARIKIYFINRTEKKLNYLTTVFLSQVSGMTVEQVAGKFVSPTQNITPTPPVDEEGIGFWIIEDTFIVS